MVFVVYWSNSFIMNKLAVVETNFLYIEDFLILIGLYYNNFRLLLLNLESSYMKTFLL